MGTGRFEVRLGDLKEEWEAYCLRHGTNPSAATKQAIRHLLNADKAKRGESVEIATSEVTRVAEASRVRKEIYFTQSELEAIEKRAVAEGGYLNINKWVIALVRAQLTHQPQFGEREMKALGESNYQLMAIGRNLNQIAHAINASRGDASKYSPELVEDVQKEVKAHVAVVGDLLRASSHRWKIK